MGPNSNESFQLPEPVPTPEQGGAAAPAEAAPSAPERASSPASGAPAAAAPPSLPPIQLPAQQAAADPAASAPPQSAQSNPSDASDNDRIEVEWVNKAKQIVEKTKDDPFKQSEELSVFKADYMKKRYNRAIKVSK